MKIKSIVVGAVVLLSYQPPGALGALSEKGLLELVEKGVSTELTIQIIECDCVDFPVDARTALRLADAVPTQVLHAAIDCFEKRGAPSVRAVPAAPQPPPGAPAPRMAVKPAPTALPPTPHTGDPYALSQIKNVALLPVVLDGKYSRRMTKAMRNELKKRRKPFELSSSFSEAERPLSNEPIESILQAARSAGVDAVMLGTGSTLTVGGYPAVQIDARLVEVNQGAVLWTAEGASQGGNISWHEARAAASKSVLNKLP